MTGKPKSPFARRQAVKPDPVLGDDCPVRPLGHNKTEYFFSDPVGQIRRLRAGEMTANGLIGLFLGDTTWLSKACAVETRGDAKRHAERPTWSNPTAVALLIAACKREGFFDPIKNARGCGVWPFHGALNDTEMFQGTPQLIVHCGDEVGWVTYSDGATLIEWYPPGCKIGDYVYPAAPPEMRPAEDDNLLTDKDMAALKDIIASWNWRDGETARQLVLGGFGIRALPASLPHRPTQWYQGHSGAGKSAVLTFLMLATGSTALKYDNGSAAGVRDDFRDNGYARAVIINEAELSDDNRRLQGLIEMARYVYTAGEGAYRRGGSQGAATDINACFTFCAIEPPPLLPQDANRIVMLRLGPLKVSEKDIEAFEDRMPKVARALAPKICGA